MVIIELTYKKGIEIVEQYLEPHRNFTRKNMEKEIFICSGPKVPRDGGVIMCSSSAEEVRNIIKEDPFYKEDIADYRIVEFNTTLTSRDCQ